MPSIQELEAEIVALDGRRRVMVELLQALRAYEEFERDRYAVRGASREGSDNQPRAGSAMAVTDRIAADLMEQVGGPVHTGAIAEQLYKLGHPLPEKNARNIVSARMSSNPRFVGRRGLGWWFSNRPWPDNNKDGGEQADS